MCWTLNRAPIRWVINRAVRDLRHAGLIRWVGAEIELLDWTGWCGWRALIRSIWGWDRSRR